MKIIDIPRTSLSRKILAGTLTALFVGLGILYVQIFNQQESDLRHNFNREGKLLVDAVSHPIRDALLTEDRPAIETSIGSLLKNNDDLRKIVVKDRHGVTMGLAERADPIHSKSNVIEFTSPVLVQTDDGSNTWSLGEVELWISRTRADSAIRNHRIRLTVTIVLIFIILFGSLALYLKYLVIRPLEQIAAGMRNWKITPNLSKAGYKFEINIPKMSQHDEIGLLASSFEELIQRLESATVSRDYFEKILSSMSEFLIIADRTGRVIFSNDAFNAAIHHSPTHGTPRKLHDLFDAKTVKELLKHSDHSTEKTPPRVIDTSLTIAGAKPETIPILLSHSSFNSSGNTDQILVVARDMSDISELRSQLVRSERLASIGTLAAGVGHEINNPLAIIRGNAETLKIKFSKLPNPLEYLKCIEIQLRSVDRISKIVKSLRQMASKVTLAPNEKSATFDVSKSITELLESIEGVMERKNLKLTSQLPTQTILVRGDGDGFQQALLNLITNARDATKHTDEGTINIQVEIGSQTVRVNVEDNGTGIEPENINRIFDSFFTTKPVGEGTGLGLSISLQSIKEMNGEIEVKSRLGMGTKFSIILPIHSKTKSVEPSPQLAPSLPIKIQKKSILIVDDELDLLELLNDLMQDLGFEVTRAINGKDALGWVEKKHFDVILTDIQMPIMNGKEFLNRLFDLQLKQKPFVIVMTGAVQLRTAQDTEMEVLKKKIDVFLPKPFTAEDLSSAISHLD